MDKKAQKDLKSIVRSEPNLIITTTMGALAESWGCSPEEMGFDEDTALDEIVRFQRNERYGDWAMLLDEADLLINNVEDEAVYALERITACFERYPPYEMYEFEVFNASVKRITE